MSKNLKKRITMARGPYWQVRWALGAKCKPTVKECDRSSGKAAKWAAKPAPPEREEA